MTTPLVLGIDFGTCRTSAAVLIGNDVHPVKFGMATEKPDMPTAVFVEGPDNILVGEEAERSMLRDPSRFFDRFKPHIGRSERILVGEAELEYRDLVAAVLEQVRVVAQNKFNNDQPLTRACITVPTLYVEGGDAWKEMEAAAKQARFKEVKLLREPHAAAIYYDSLLRNDTSKSDQITLVYDLGGGTFDPALIQRCKGDYRILGAISGEEGVRCGGIYFDEKIREDFARKCPSVLERMRFDASSEDSPSERRRKYRDILDLREMLQQAKIQLSHPGISEYRGFEPTEDLEFHLRREEFEAMISPLLDATLDSCDVLVRRSGLEWKKIDRILMVGGSCSIPLVRKKLEAYAKNQGASPEICWRRIGTTNRLYEPMLAVGYGAAHGIGMKESRDHVRRKTSDALPSRPDPARKADPKSLEDRPSKRNASPKTGSLDRRNETQGLSRIVPLSNERKARTGQFLDPRDGRSYRTVVIGRQTWFAENLAYRTVRSRSNGWNEEFGLLYDWEDARQSCPPGWHLPTDKEWLELEMFVGMDKDTSLETGWRNTNSEGVKLKSKQGWDKRWGSDEYGLGIQPEGFFGCDGALGKGAFAYFWSSTPERPSFAWYRCLGYNNGGIARDTSEMSDGFSVRCVKDSR